MYHHARQSQRHARQDAQCAAVHPHLVVAIDKDVGQHEHEQTDKQTAAEVDATQAYPVGHGAEGAAHHQLHAHHHAHGADDEYVHHLPGEVIAEPRRQEGAALDRREQHDMEHGEEHGKVAAGSYPQLDVAHQLKGALQLGHAAYEAHHQQ